MRGRVCGVEEVEAGAFDRLRLTSRYPDRSTWLVSLVPARVSHPNKISHLPLCDFFFFLATVISRIQELRAGA
jgi:hypothetical protein